MRIIFDSKEQRDAVFIKGLCPGRLGLPEYDAERCATGRCADCWKDSGLEVEIKESKDDNHI